MVVFEVQKPKKSPLGTDCKNLSSRFQEATDGSDCSLIEPGFGTVLGTKKSGSLDCFHKAGMISR